MFILRGEADRKAQTSKSSSNFGFHGSLTSKCTAFKDFY